ncbi:rod shape-determining protein MreC [bacterium]|nr:rod shape-determining protein MreC [bacterium]
MSVKLTRKWKKYKDRCLLIAAIVFSIFLMAIDQTSPIQSIKIRVTGWVGRIHDGISWLPRSLIIRKENERLMVELGKIAMQQFQVQDMIGENSRLRRLLDFQERNQYLFIPARVVGMGSTGIPGSVYLNVGFENGCQDNMVLMTDKGIVGKVISVSRTTSIGQIVTDPNFRISGRVQRSRVLGIVRWLYSNVCVLEGVHQRADVQTGDLVVTSGYSQIYPQGLPIGRIYWVSHEEEDLFQEVRLQLEVDFNTLEEVLVLKETVSDEHEQ